MAARVKANINPALITWARESAGYSIAEAAEKIGVKPEQLTEWEKADSEEKPSIPQLRKISEVTKRPLAVFYLAKVPKDFQVIRDLRRLPGVGMRKFSPELQYEIRLANERRQLALEMAEDLEETPRKFSLSAKLADDTEKVGERIRKALGVDDGIQLNWRDKNGRNAFNGWRNRIEGLGALIFQAVRLGDDEASGIAIVSDTLPIIVVNRKDALTRRTFSLLHELAHIMIHVSGVSDLHTDEKRPAEDQKIEVFCNQVAAAALIPKDSLLAEQRVIAQGMRSTKWSDEDIRELALRFNVSREALLRRLLTFDRTTNEFYRKKRQQFITEYQAQKARKKKEQAEKEMARNMPQETMSNLGSFLVGIVLGNYYQEKITLSDVAGYLKVKTKHIPKIEELSRAR